MAADKATELELVFKTKTPIDILDVVDIIGVSNDEWSTDMVRVLADATRDEKWRIALRRLGLPRILMRQWPHPCGKDPAITRHTLRILGNLCIGDTDTKVFCRHHLPIFAKCLLDQPENFDVNVGVLFNMFNEDAGSTDEGIELGFKEDVASTKKLIELGIHTRLAVGLVKDRIIGPENPMSDTAVSLLASLVNSNFKTGPVSQNDTLPEFLLSMVLLPTLDWDEEDAIRDEALETAMILLSVEDIQRQIAAQHSALLSKNDPTYFEKESIMLAFMHLYEAQVITVETLPDKHFTQAGEDEAALRIIHDFQSLASDLASMFEYRDTEEMVLDPLMNQFKLVWADQTSPLARIHQQAIVFLMLGNIARKKELCVALVKEFDFHERAILLIRNVGDEYNSARMPAVGFLCNLANAEENKTVIRQSKIIHDLCHSEFPEDLKYGLRLLRSIVRDSPASCKQLLDPSSDDLITMDDLNALLPAMAQDSRNDVGRLFVQILRITQRAPTSDFNMDSFMTAVLVHVLVDLVRLGVGNMFASEGLLGLGLASQSPVGARLVYTALQAESPPFDSIKKALDQDPATVPTATQDRANAAVILSQLEKHVDYISDEAKLLSKSLLKDQLALRESTAPVENGSKE